MLLEDILDVNPEMKDFLEAIEKCEITGSRVFGVHKDNSDYDVLVSENQVIQDMINKYRTEVKFPPFIAAGYGPNEDNFTCRVVINAKEYNLIVLNTPMDYKRWVYATAQVKMLCEIPCVKNLIRDKENRIVIFRKFKESYKENV